MVLSPCVCAGDSGGLHDTLVKRTPACPTLSLCSARRPPWKALLDALERLTNVAGRSAQRLG
jgi:hypothetical protein